MFGYLNLNDPTKIAEDEAQIAQNCRFDRGYLEYYQWGPVDDSVFMKVFHPISGYEIHLDKTKPLGFFTPVYRSSPSHGVFNDPFGCPSLAEIRNMAVGEPSLMAIGHSSNPYPPGVYQYIFTIYDQRFSEESYNGGLVYSVLIGVNQVTRISLPIISHLFPTKILHWRIYRRPLGASEFLFVAQVPGNTVTYIDMVTTDMLGTAYNTQKNVRFVSSTRHLKLYQQMLFYGSSFSEKGIYWASSPTNDFGFSVNSLVSLGETLYLFGDRGKYRILYGNSVDDFVLKDSDADCPTISYSAVSRSGLILLLNMEAVSITIGGQVFEGIPCISGISSVSGSSHVDFSGKIKPMFPLLPYYSGEVSHGFPVDLFVAPYKIVEDRFIVWRYAGLLHRQYASMEAFWQATKVPYYLVYDIVGNGFLIGTSSPAFIYRTKMFGFPNKIQQVRRIFVEYSGMLTVIFNADNYSWTSYYSLPSVNKRTSVVLSVKPHPHHYHFFEFQGNNPDAKVYSYGVVE